MRKLTPEETARYERSLRVEGFDTAAQQKLAAAAVLVVGAGGLGSAVLPYLAAAGVGRIGVADYDLVSPGNLQRQILYATPQIGLPKAVCAAERLTALNPYVQIDVHNCKINVDNADNLIAEYDIIIDCSDNYEVRYIVDNACLRCRKPFIYGTAEQMRGQLSTFHYKGAGGYAGLYPRNTRNSDGPPGVLSPVPGVVGSLQAMEAVKIITGLGSTLQGKLLTIDLAEMKFTLFEIG